MCWWRPLWSQNYAFQIFIDNDYLTDQYYTAGADLQYIRQGKTTKQGRLFQYDITYGLRIHTPKEYDEDFSTDVIDHPYSGVQQLTLGFQWISPKHLWRWTMRQSLVGPQAGGAGIHSVSPVLGIERNPWLGHTDRRRVRRQSRRHLHPRLQTWGLRRHDAGVDGRHWYRIESSTARDRLSPI